jgi:hypothetical protein
MSQIYTFKTAKCVPTNCEKASRLSLKRIILSIKSLFLIQMGWKKSAAVTTLFITAVLLIAFQLPGLVLNGVAGVDAINPPVAGAAIFATALVDILIVAPICMVSARMIRRNREGGSHLALISGGAVEALYLMWLGTSLWMWHRNAKIDGIDFFPLWFIAYNSLFVVLGLLILILGIVIHRKL